MGLFDDQIKARKLNDDIAFENSFLNIAKALVGHKIKTAFEDDKRITRDAIDAILKYYQIEPEDVPDDICGIEEQLDYILRPKGIMRRTVKLSKGWYKNAVGALLGVRKDDNTVVALIPGKFRGYSFYDGKTGENTYVNRENEDIFEDEAFCFYTSLPLKKLDIKDIVSYCLSVFSVSDYLSLVLAGFVSTLFGLIVPAINREIFSNVIYQKDVTYLLAIAVFLISVSISKLIFKTIETVLESKISTKMGVTIEAAAMIRILSLPAGFFKDYSAGELSARIDYLRMLCEIMINIFLRTGLTSLLSFIYVFQIVNYTPYLVVPALAIILISAVISTTSTLIEMKVSKKRMEVGAKVSGLSFAFISGIQKIKLSGAEKRAFSKWGNEYAKQVELAYNYPKFLCISPVITNAVMLVGTFIIYKTAIDTGVGVADFYAFNSAYAFMSTAFISLSAVTNQMALIKPVLEMLAPIFEAVPETTGNKQMVEHISGGVEINNLCFKYNDNMPNVIDGLSIKIKPGQYVAIVGKTGCGKSTLLRLLLGFEKADKGGIYYDGRDIDNLDLKSLRQNIEVVMQNSTLFGGSIFSNIAISNPSLTLDGAWEAARQSGIEEDIKAMPMGMFTIVSEGGGGLSGGQRQRIMIARALASNPKLLIFDEATSALDNITQKIVADSLNNLKCTRIVIAHRLSTIKNCDRIIVIDGGKIIEDGTYDELNNSGGFFSELVKRQQVGV